jgi:pyridoxal phosphate enzyme (YggS family)
MEVPERLAQVREQIARAAERAGRSPDEIRVLAATKGRSVAEILEAIRAGIDLIGENTVQEALSKFEFIPPKVERHMIGTLQLNKVKTVVKLFDMIESVDSLELACEIDRQAQKAGKPFPVLIEVNPAGEVTKRGLAPEGVEELLDRIRSFEYVRVKGLMAMMPYDDPERLRPYFRVMRELFESLKGREGVEMEWLSMGMSHDYEVAVEEGANLVRLGTCLFGPRRGK